LSVENQGIEIPGEVSGSSLAPDSDTAIVEKAKQKGWAPIDSWRGNPEDWVDAREFLGREKLYSTIHELRKDIANIKNATQKDFQVIAEHFSKMREVEYKRALDDLRAQRREAIQDGDLDKADALESQMDEIKEARVQAKATAPQATASVADPVFEAWKQENDWFDKDANLRNEAIGIAVGFANANPGISQPEVLKYVTEKIRKFNPDKFGERTEMDDEPRQPTVESPSRRGTSGTPARKGKISVADLSTQQRDIMNTLIKRGVLNEAAAKNKRTPEQEYLAQLAEVSGL
jgi:hypothetical protein